MRSEMFSSVYIMVSTRGRTTSAFECSTPKPNAFGWISSYSMPHFECFLRSEVRSAASSDPPIDYNFWYRMFNLIVEPNTEWANTKRHHRQPAQWACAAFRFAVAKLAETSPNTSTTTVVEGTLYFQFVWRATNNCYTSIQVVGMIFVQHALGYCTI